MLHVSLFVYQHHRTSFSFILWSHNRNQTEIDLAASPWHGQDLEIAHQFDLSLYDLGTDVQGLTCREMIVDTFGYRETQNERKLATFLLNTSERKTHIFHDSQGFGSLLMPYHALSEPYPCSMRSLISSEMPWDMPSFCWTQSHLWWHAWKKEVWEGSMPVGPEGMYQSTMEVLSGCRNGTSPNIWTYLNKFKHRFLPKKKFAQFYHSEEWYDSFFPEDNSHSHR